MIPAHTLFDTSYELETPEGVDLHVELAGPVVRTLAFTIDFFIRFTVLIVLGIASLLLGGGNVSWAIWLLAYFLLEWWYPVLFEVFRFGQTPGKKAMGLAVVNDDLTPISIGPSLVRNLLRAADFLPFCYTSGFICMAAHPHFQRLGDIAAGTIVIHQAGQDLAQATPDIHPTVPPFELNSDEQTAIVEFTLRHKELSDDRQQELAEILKDSFNSRPEQLVPSLRSIGAWLLGAR
ncbi:MAG: putative RDD family membrane protein YckC [Flavobacteriales bacterium]